MNRGEEQQGVFRLYFLKLSGCLRTFGPVETLREDYQRAETAIESLVFRARRFLGHRSDRSGVQPQKVRRFYI
jgi:hypothetical protein